MKEHINLIIDERSSLRAERQIAPESMILPGLVLLLLLALGFSFTWQAKRIARTEAQVKGLQLQRDGLRANIEQWARAGDHRRGEGAPVAAGDLLGPRSDWAAVMREVSWIVPEGIYLTGLDSRGVAAEGKTASEKTVHFTGNAVSHRAIAKFLSALEQSGRFEHVALVFADKTDSSGGLVGFEITGELKPITVQG